MHNVCSKADGQPAQSTARYHTEKELNNIKLVSI